MSNSTTPSRPGSAGPESRPVADLILDANRQYAEGFTDPGLDARPARKVAVVTCMDARLNLPEALGLELGDLHTIRNAGGVLTDDVIRSLTISQRALGTRSVVVIHHTGCGLLGLTEDFRLDLEREVGTRPAWAVGGFADLDEDVRGAVEQIRTSPFLLHTDDVRGFVFDVTTGRLREVATDGAAAGGPEIAPER